MVENSSSLSFALTDFESSRQAEPAVPPRLASSGRCARELATALQNDSIEAKENKETGWSAVLQWILDETNDDGN